MAIFPNRYNDPNLAAAFSNLAGMFAPLSGPDAAGYANARAKKEEAARLAHLFAAPTQPDFDRATWDLQNTAAGVYTPVQSWSAQDQNNATALRGQDVTAQTDLRVAGINADSALGVARLNNAGALERQMALPVILNEGQSAFLPQQTQEATGLAGMFTGAVSADPGERVTLPNGQVISGAPKPLSETELRAAILSEMPETDQEAFALGDIPIEKIILDGQPVYVRRPDAVGQTPAPTSPLVTVGTGEGAYDRTLNENLAKIYIGYGEQADSARRALNVLDAMERASRDPGFYSGIGGDFVRQGKQVLAAMGVDPSGVDGMETFSAMSKQAALDSLGGSLGSGFSNADRDYVSAQVPNLDTTPAGNRALIDIQRKIQRRKIEIADFAAAYAEAHDGRIDGNFNTELGKWAEQHPLFDVNAQSAGAAPPAVVSAASAAPTRRTIDGVTYERDAGGNWFAVE